MDRSVTCCLGTCSRKGVARLSETILQLQPPQTSLYGRKSRAQVTQTKTKLIPYAYSCCRNLWIWLNRLAFHVCKCPIVIVPKLLEFLLLPRVVLKYLYFSGRVLFLCRIFLLSSSGALASHVTTARDHFDCFVRPLPFYLLLCKGC